eukprot:7652828-Lingulodinium_polyedra.AAC.1
MATLEEGRDIWLRADCSTVKMFVDPELAEDFVRLDMTALRQVKWTNRVPPPGWRPVEQPLDEQEEEE